MSAASATCPVARMRGRACVPEPGRYGTHAARVSRRGSSNAVCTFGRCSDNAALQPPSASASVSASVSPLLIGTPLLFGRGPLCRGRRAGRGSNLRKAGVIVRAQAGSGRGGGEDRKNEGLDLVQVFAGAGRAVWGKGLPPGALVQVARESWKAAWRVMMSQLAPTDSSGTYKRTPSVYRRLVSRDSPIFPPEPSRYALYVALSCPWAHRAIIVHTLKGLGDAVPLVVTRPGASGLWEFATPSTSLSPSASRTPSVLSSGQGGGGKGGGGKVETKIVLSATSDYVNGRSVLKEVYELQEGGYDGRATVPMLWDTKTRQVVNNESSEIIRILNSAFDEWAANPSLDLAPSHLREQMDQWDEEIYQNVNNGVYCCGFATSQSAYDNAVRRLFLTLDSIDAHLATHRYLCGPHLTLSDVRLFTTLVRFDAAYHTIFKCSTRKIVEYKNLYGYLRDIYQMEGVAETCDAALVCESYFGSLFPLNPGGIVPTLPQSSLPDSLLRPHGREHLSDVEGQLERSS